MLMCEDMQTVIHRLVEVLVARRTMFGT